MVYILFSRMVSQTQLKMCLLIKYLLSEFCALVMIAGHSRSLLHKTGYNGVHCRNESVSPNFWTAVYARPAIRATNPSLLDCWARAPVTLSATDRWIAYTQPCFQWSSVAASHGAAALRRVGSVTTAEALEKIAVWPVKMQLHPPGERHAAAAIHRPAARSHGV